MFYTNKLLVLQHCISFHTSGNNSVTTASSSSTIYRTKSTIKLFIKSDLEDKLQTYNKINGAIPRHFGKQINKKQC